mgnify:CR=1 FL=1
MANIKTVDETNHDQTLKLLNDLKTLSERSLENQKLFNEDLIVGIKNLVYYIIEVLNHDDLIKEKTYRDLPSDTKREIRKLVKDLFGVDLLVEEGDPKIYNFKT